MFYTFQFSLSFILYKFQLCTGLYKYWEILKTHLKLYLVFFSKKTLMWTHFHMLKSLLYA